MGSTSEADQERLNRDKHMAMRLATLYALNRDIAAFRGYVAERERSIALRSGVDRANEDDTALRMLSRIEMDLRILFGRPDPVLPNDDPDISRPQGAATPKGEPLSSRPWPDGSISGKSAQPASDTYACPHCSETMKVIHVP